MPAHNPAETVILIAEDEVTIRILVTAMLNKEGYGTLAVANGEEALEVCSKFPDKIHLLLTNVTMPKMNGLTLVEEIVKVRTDIKIIVMSGQMDEAILSGNRPDAFLRKPFVPPKLLNVIRQVLDGERLGLVEV